MVAHGSGSKKFGFPERAVYPLSSVAHVEYPSRSSHSASAAGEAAYCTTLARNAWEGSVFALASDLSQDGLT